MLIGLREKFIFIATQKTASTAIETALAPRADIRLTESQFGKHMTVSQMMQNLPWLFNETKPDQFFIFGVIRDPLEFTLSLFNSHLHPGFRNMPHVYTGGMRFSDFLADWVPRNLPQIVPQHSRFLDGEGRIGANYIITYARLQEGLRAVAQQLGGRPFPRLKTLNSSPPGIDRRNLKPLEIAWVEQHFAQDYRFITRYCDRRLTSFKERPDLG
jgi:hypothetical protein